MTPNLRWRTLGTSILLLSVAFASAQTSVRVDPKGGAATKSPALAKMIGARGKLRYSGQRVVEIVVDGERRRNIESVLVDGVRSRTEFLAGSQSIGQVIVEGPGKRMQYYPDRNEIFVLPARKDEGLTRMLNLFRAAGNRGRVRESSGGMVAGRATTLVSLSDRANNPVTKAWIDDETGLLLKRELFDQSGRRVGLFEFEKVNFKPVIDEKDFTIDRKGAKFLTMDDILGQRVRNLGWVAMRLTPKGGFRIESVRVMDIAGVQVLVQVYTGDLRRVTLYQFQGTIDESRMRQFADGPKLETLVLRDGSVTRVLVGDLTKADLQRLSASLIQVPFQKATFRKKKKE